MSILPCESCEDWLDTDDEPHVFREEYDFECLCDACYEARREEVWA